MRSPNESALGVVKICGSSARGMSMIPPPSRRTDASVVLAVSAQAGPAVETNAERTWGVVQFGWRCRSSAAAPATCGADMLVPSNGANGSLANSGSVEERISPPGAETSGFSKWPNAVGPAEEKNIIVPPRPG